MSRSTTRPHGKWYESEFHFLFGFRKFTEEELDLVCAERKQDEEERIRAAEALADWKLMENWQTYNEALNPPSAMICSVDDFMTRRVVRGTDGVQALLRNFWKERV